MTTRITFAMEVNMGKIQELRAILSAKIDGKEITQVGLAKATGVDQATINRFYKKGEGLSAENFIRLAEWVGARIVWPGEGTLVHISITLVRVKKNVYHVCSKCTQTNRIL